MIKRIKEFILLADMKRWLLVLLPILILLVQLALMFYYDHLPERFSVKSAAATHAAENGSNLVTGYTTANTLREVASRLLTKRGGFLTNDVTPPSTFMDNVPNWEFGVIEQIRDLSLALRNDHSRSQTQSAEDPALVIAHPRFNNDTEDWMFPRAETRYQEGIDALEDYLQRLADPTEPDAQFYARADNLGQWLDTVSKRLGSLSERLSASVAEERVNTDLSGDPAATQATRTTRSMTVRTPWLDIDDVFFEARGAAWALLHFLEAVEVDFESVLDKKNAMPSLRQIQRHLEATQDRMWSPMVLNGTGFALFANHSLVMASYLSRANAAVIDLRDLLAQG